MRFEFATATRIIFGEGTIQEAMLPASKMGSNAFVVTGRSTERAEPLLQQLNKQQVKYITFSVPTEPTTVMVKQAVKQSRQAKCNLVIGIGGGSVLDTGKAVAAMLTNAGELEEYLEVVGAGKSITQNPAPYIAIPTTAGTGAEVTRNAVLAVPEHRVKVSMRSPLMLPRLAIVDPMLTHSMPPSLTASTGLDALTQLVEAYVSKSANALTESICREGLRRAGGALQRAYEDGSDSAAREDMALASLFSGLALANAKLGAVHGLAGPLGGMVAIAHGVLCARLLPHVTEINIRSLQSYAKDSPALARYDEVAQLLTGDAAARAEDCIKWMHSLCAALDVPTLTQAQLSEQDFQVVIEKSRRSSSMKGNPVVLTDEQIIGILKKEISVK